MIELYTDSMNNKEAVLNESRKCLDCGTEIPDGERFYCDAFCTIRSTAAIPSCGDLLCNNSGACRYQEAK